MSILFEQAHPVHRFMRATGATAPMSWLSARVMHRLDKGVHRITAGRTTFAGIVTGLPVVMLTTTGARSGQPRTWPLLGLRDGDRIVVVASNYGQRNHPAWYHNLRANPIASVAVDGAATQRCWPRRRGATSATGSGGLACASIRGGLPMSAARHPAGSRFRSHPTVVTTCRQSVGKSGKSNAAPRPVVPSSADLPVATHQGRG